MKRRSWIIVEDITGLRDGYWHDKEMCAELLEELREEFPDGRWSMQEYIHIDDQQSAFDMRNDVWVGADAARAKLQTLKPQNPRNLRHH